TARAGIVRKCESKTLALTLGEVPQERHANAAGDDRDTTGAPRLGLTLAPADSVAGSGGKGVVVTAVDPDGPAADQGFKTGDVILDVAGKAGARTPHVTKAPAAARADAKRAVRVR